MSTTLPNCLNEEQKRVVMERDRNLLVLAAAGTGKTDTLARRIAALLEEHRAAPEEILCLTFTNRACKEMKERIMQIVPEGKDVIVKTFHAFCFLLIQEFAKQDDISSDFVIFDEVDCQALLSEIAFVHLPGSIQTVYRFLTHLKEQRLLFPEKQDAEIVTECAKTQMEQLERICYEDGKLNRPLLYFLIQYAAPLLKRYDLMLSERHALDFNDILLRAKRILDHPANAQAVTKRFSYIHIDEVQDTTLLEYRILEKLFSHSKLLLCGDYFQTIYQWRGSKPRDIFTDFCQKYHPIQISFHNQYRSTAVLTEASIAFLKASFEEQMSSIYGDGLLPHSQEKGNLIGYFAASDIHQEAKFIYHKILELAPKDLSRVAILCRNNSHNRKLSMALEEYNHKYEDALSFLLTEQVKFFQSAEIKDVLACLRLLINRYDSTAVSRILLRYARGMDLSRLHELESRENRKKGIAFCDFIRMDAVLHADPYYSLLTAFQEENVVVFDVESTGVNPSIDEIIQIAAVRLTADGNVKDSFQTLLQSTRPVGSSEAIHHISDEKLKNKGEPPIEALRSFCEFAKDCVIVGHNVGFDITILQHQLSRLGLPPAQIADDYDTLDLARRFYPNLPNHKLETLSQFLDTQTKSSHDAMDDIMATGEILCHFISKFLIPMTAKRQEVFENHSFKKLAWTLSELRLHMADSSLSKLMERIIETMHIRSLWKENLTSMRNLDELLELCHQAENMEDRITEQIQEFLKLAVLSSTNLDRLLKLHPRIPILTVHQAKGAEFDIVFLAGLQDDTFPTYQSVRQNDLSEERRTFYVAMTRPKKQLFFTCCLEIDGRKKNPSRFIQDIPFQYIKQLN